MTFFHSIVLGIVEGLTEFLPISSTGHLILASHLYGLAPSDFVKSFEVSIQLGAILAIVALYWKKLFVEFEIAKKIAVAFIPTGVLGFVFYKVVKSTLLGNPSIVLWSLFMGGIVLILFELRYKEKEHATRDLRQISYRQSLFIGALQGISMIPGVSRAGATIIGGLFAGLDRKTVVEFSFLLAVPTMLAATGYDLVKNSHSFSAEQFRLMAVGGAVSFATAMLAVHFFLAYIQKHSFIIFGVYRIALVLLLWNVF